MDWMCVLQIHVLEPELPKYCVLKSVPTFWHAMVYWYTSIAHQTPLSMGFLRQEYWRGLLFPSSGNLPDPGIEPRSLPLRADSLPSEPPSKPIKVEWALRIQHSSNRFSVSTKWNTREFSLLSLCLCVLSSVLHPHPPPCVRTHGETILGRKSSYQNLPLLVPWSGNKFLIWGNKFLVFIPLSLWYSFMAFLADKYKIIHFWKLKKKHNERKLKRLLHFLGTFEISQNWSFLDFYILWADSMFDLDNVLLEVWLMQPSSWKDNMAQSFTQRYLLGAWRATVHGVSRVGHDLATKPPPP